jgi:hypothetical protein
LNIEERKKNLVNLISKLDITPTMYKNAKEKYESIAAFLKSKGIEADIYPQGSFRMGTVVRPYREGKDVDYDLDVVCQLNFIKEETTPKNVKLEIGQELIDSELYSNKLKPECDRCWTLQYAKVDNDIGFSLDIVPSVQECKEVIESVINTGIQAKYANDAIAITHKQNGIYSWVQSNPKGYATWFDEINAPFLAFNREERRKELFEKHRNIYASVEDIPPLLERSSLQRVIQILKRHRDIYYERAKCPNRKPISAIITTLTAKIAQKATPNMNVYDLLKYVSEELYIYSELLNRNQLEFEKAYQARTYIRKNGKKWTITNPINPNDNYTETWDDTDAQRFFMWIKAVKDDFISNAELDEDRYFNGLENGMGKNLVEPIKPKAQIFIPPITVSQTKPWGEI